MNDGGTDMRSDAAQPSMTDEQQWYYRPRSRVLRWSYRLACGLNRCLIRMLFRFSVVGREHLPEGGAFVLAPNHSSPLDPPVLAAALPLSTLQNTFWAGKQSTVLRNRLRRRLSRLTRVIPIDHRADSLPSAMKVLNDGHSLVWFPEGRRSLDGQLQPLRSGIVSILVQCDVPVVPVRIEGAHKAFPGRGHWPRLRTPISVQIQPALTREQLGATEDVGECADSVLENLREYLCDPARVRPDEENDV